jgi:uncharacterized protein (DUF58 family)
VTAPAPDNAATGAGAPAATPLRSALTTRGRVLLCGAILVLAAGLYLNYPELIGLGVVGVAAVLAALAAVARSPRVVVRRTIEPPRVTRGSAAGASAHVIVQNASRRTLPAMAARDRAGSDAAPFAIPRLRPGADHPAAIPLPVQRRGVVPSGPLLVARDDPFGLAHRTLEAGLAGQLYVRPRVIPLPEIAASLARSVDGPQADSTMEGTLAFHALREYVPGDELRHVHWRASAHAGKLVVKQHVDTAHAAVAVVLDLVADAGDGRPADTGLPAGLPEVFDAAVDCAASVALIAVEQRHPLQLTDGAGESLLPGTVRRRGGCTVDDVLDALTRVTAVPGQARRVDPLADTLRRLAGGARGSLAVVVSTRPMGGLADSLRLLAGCYARVVAVQAVAPGTVGGAARTGQVVWVMVQRVDDLPAALMRARTAA